MVVYLYTGLLDIHSLSDQTWQGTHVESFFKCTILFTIFDNTVILQSQIFIICILD